MLRLDAGTPDFAARFDELANARREADEDVSARVREIIARVRAEGDACLRALTLDYDRHDLDTTGWRVPQAEIDAALDGIDLDLRAALELAASRIAAPP